MFCNEDNDIRSNSTQILELVYVTGHIIGRNQDHRIAISNFCIGYIKITILKQAPLLHNTVLVLCDEGTRWVPV